MSVGERDDLSTFLFGRDDVEVMNIKFMRGSSASLTPEKMSETARVVLADFWQQGAAAVDQPPRGRRAQREVAEIIAEY